jgi:hypothetical protein
MVYGLAHKTEVLHFFQHFNANFGGMRRLRTDGEPIFTAGAVQKWCAEAG